MQRAIRGVHAIIGAEVADVDWHVIELRHQRAAVVRVHRLQPLLLRAHHGLRKNLPVRCRRSGVIQIRFAAVSNSHDTRSGRPPPPASASGSSSNASMLSSLKRARHQFAQDAQSRHQHRGPFALFNDGVQHNRVLDDGAGDDRHAQVRAHGHGGADGAIGGRLRGQVSHPRELHRHTICQPNQL